mmetsp:Transcript_28850/g.70343  ORF Transcript_28850/g.70343 Transcript_28850/m.70343 type:complete len:101 (-) Transcript_28850:77-379(-)
MLERFVVSEMAQGSVQISESHAQLLLQGQGRGAGAFIRLIPNFVILASTFMFGEKKWNRVSWKLSHLGTEMKRFETKFKNMLRGNDSRASNGSVPDRKVN